MSAEVHAARRRAHDTFDWVWRNGHMKRVKAYAQFAAHLGMTPDECNMKLMGVDDCERVVEAVGVLWSRRPGATMPAETDTPAARVSEIMEEIADAIRSEDDTLRTRVWIASKLGGVALHTNASGGGTGEPLARVYMKRVPLEDRRRHVPMGYVVVWADGGASIEHVGDEARSAVAGALARREVARILAELGAGR